MKEHAAVLDRPEVGEIPEGSPEEAGAEKGEMEELEAQARESIASKEAETTAAPRTERTSAAFEKAARVARGPMTPFIEQLADRVGARATVSAAYGEPVVQGARTVVPVARVAWGFGGGSGEDTEGAGGTGAGGGGMVRPIGYLEITDETAEFRPLRPAWADPGLIMASAFAGWFVLRAVRALFRR